MFCENCGNQLPDDSKFCKECGSATNKAQAAAAQPPPQQEQEKKKGGFFTSPGGIVLIVILAVLVAGGIATGVVLIVMNSANNSVDAATVKVWDEYESLLAADSEGITTISMDAAALAKTQADLKKTQERVVALEKIVKETGGTPKRRSGVKTKNVRDQKADEMEAAIGAYTKFVQKMIELVTTLNGGNLLDPNVVATLNRILTELQTLSASVTKLNNAFLTNNGKVTTTVAAFKPSILKTPVSFSQQIQKDVTNAQAAEQQRLAAEKAAADQAAAAAAAQAEQQRQEAAAAQRQQEQQQQETTTSDCGDPNCPI